MLGLGRGRCAVAKILILIPIRSPWGPVPIFIDINIMKKGKKSTYFFHKCRDIAKIKMESKTSVSSDLYLVICT